MALDKKNLKIGIVTFFYANNYGGIAFNDSDLGIDWKLPADQLLLSDKDKELPFLKDCINTLQF